MQTLCRIGILSALVLQAATLTGCNASSFSGNSGAASSPPAAASAAKSNHQDAGNCLRLIGAKGTTQAYPAVRLVGSLITYQGQRTLSSCNVTFIGPDTALAVMGCSSAGSFDGYFLLPTSYNSSDVFDYYTTYPQVKKAITATGSLLAILQFPAGTVSDYLQVATISRPLGTQVTLVGNGATSNQRQGTTQTSAIGTNTLVDLASYPSWASKVVPGSLYVVGSETNTGQPNATVPSWGDGGAPMIVNQTVIGVTNAFSFASGDNVQHASDPSAVGFYTDLTIPAFQTQVAQAKSSSGVSVFLEPAATAQTGTATPVAVGAGSGTVSIPQPAATAGSGC